MRITSAEVDCPACGTHIEVQLMAEQTKRQEWAAVVDESLRHEAEHHDHDEAGW